MGAFRPGEGLFPCKGPGAAFFELHSVQVLGMQPALAKDSILGAFHCHGSTTRQETVPFPPAHRESHTEFRQTKGMRLV